MTHTDYSTARFYAIGGMGYGKGFTPEEAWENYVAIQLRNFRAADTVFGTRAKFKAALEVGELAPDVWRAPEGVSGFVVDHRGLWWTSGPGNDYTEPEVEAELIAPNPLTR